MTVIWSKKANLNYRKNLVSLKKAWNYKVLETFINETDKCIETIKFNPSLGQFDKPIGCNKIINSKADMPILRNT